MFRNLVIVFTVFALIPILSVSQTISEVLGRPTNNSVTVSVLFNQQVDVYFEFGTVKNNYSGATQPVIIKKDEPAEIIIQGLKPDSRYYYRARYRIPGETVFKLGNEHTFVTQRTPGKTFCFTIEADPHPYDKKCYDPLWNIALQNQLKDSADFMIDMGDTFGDDHNPFTITSTELQQLHLNSRNFFAAVCHSLPLYFCMGNHEGESGYYLLQNPPDNLAVNATLWRKFYFPNPFPDGFCSGNSNIEPHGVGFPENYYSWEWGDALFIVLDMYRYYTLSAKPGKWEWTMGKTQYDWFRQTLEKSKAKYKLVFAHHVLGEARGAAKIAKQYEWGSTNATDFASNRPGWEMPIHQLMVKNKVNIFFQGHDHLYAREELDGLVYQTVPMPSDSSYNLGMIANADAFGGVKLAGSGHLKVTVYPEKIQVDYILAVLPRDENSIMKNRQVANSFFITSAGTATSASSIPVWQTQEKVKVYPNPFRNQLNIQFNLQERGNVEIRIYDISGRQVEHLNAGFLEKGSNLIRLDFDIKQKSSIPALYNLILNTPDGNHVERIISHLY